MAEPERRPCKECGCPLIIVMGPNGKYLPLDERSRTYEVKQDLLGAFTALPSPAYVTHFASCPAANKFSGSKKK